MGTNYYWRFRNCDSCKRYEEIHVGKSSGTWRAYPHKLMNEEHPEWGYEIESPVGFPVLNMVDWRRVFADIPGELWNEYEEQISDPLAWLEQQKPWKPGPDGLRYFEEDVRSGRGWVDADGFKFYNAEFW